MRSHYLLPALLLGATALGCKTLQYTAGVCDCNPPAVESILAGPQRPTPYGGLQMPPAAVKSAAPMNALPAPAAPVNVLPPAPNAPVNTVPQPLPGDAPPAASVLPPKSGDTPGVPVPSIEPGALPRE